MDESRTHDDNQAIKDFVASHPDGVIASATLEGRPQASVVYFSVDDDMNFYFTTKSQTRKAQNIGERADVSIAIHDAPSQTVVKVAGKAERLSDPEETLEVYRRATVRGAEAAGADNVPPIARITAGEFVAYRIKPDFLDFKSFSHGNNFRTAMEHATDRREYGNPN